MRKKLYIILLLSESIAVTSHRPLSQQYLDRQDDFVPYDDIMTWALEEFPDINSIQLGRIAEESMMHATISGKTQETLSGTLLYSKQTVFNHVRSLLALQQSKAQPLEYTITSDVSELPCSHQFHTACILQLIRVSTLCPICRKQFVPSTIKTPQKIRADDSCAICFEALAQSSPVAPAATAQKTRKKRPQSINYGTRKKPWIP